MPPFASEQFHAITRANPECGWNALTATGVPLDYLHGMTANNDWQPGANLTLALAGHWRLNGQVLAVERPHRLSYTSHGAFFMSASRCAVRLVVPVVVMAPFLGSWSLLRQPTAGMAGTPRCSQ